MRDKIKENKINKLYRNKQDMIYDYHYHQRNLKMRHKVQWASLLLNMVLNLFFNAMLPLPYFIIITWFLVWYQEQSAREFFFTHRNTHIKA